MTQRISEKTDLVKVIGAVPAKLSETIKTVGSVSEKVGDITGSIPECHQILIPNLQHDTLYTSSGLPKCSQILLPTRYKKLYSGKVRDTYEYPDNPDRLIIIATDRVSTHDVVHNSQIPGKGEALTQISNFWFRYFQTEGSTKNIPTQMIPDAAFPDDFPEELKSRTIIVKKLTPLPIEAIVRGYLYGSALKGYNKETGKLSTGEFVGEGLEKCSRFDAPLFTPSTKADMGEHDENINIATMELHLQNWLRSKGFDEDKAEEYTNRVEAYALRMYNTATAFASSKGIVIGDTKFEFGLDEEGKLHIIDEILTPDSSRFWKASTCKPGKEPESFDKQPLRDEADAMWKKDGTSDTKPPVTFSPEAIADTAKRYGAMRKIFS